MNEKKSFNQKLDGFFAGKGFYIVLFLCVAIIGVSTYFLLANRGANVEDNLEQTVLPRSSEELGVAPSAVIGEPPSLEQHGEEVDPGSEETSKETGEEEALGEQEVWSEQEAEVAAGAQFIWPLEGEISLPYSVSSLIYNKKMGDWRTNDCVNITASLGTQVVAIASGTVTSVTVDDVNGTTVTIEHAGGLKSVYSNLATVPTVYEGDSVMTGEVIGSVGTTAVGTTPESTYLCLKMTLDGASVDPNDYLPPR